MHVRHVPLAQEGGERAINSQRTWGFAFTIPTTPGKAHVKTIAFLPQKDPSSEADVTRSSELCPTRNRVLLPQGANKSICRPLRVQRTNVSDVQETGHLVRHVCLEKPGKSNTGTSLERQTGRRRGKGPPRAGWAQRRLHSALLRVELKPQSDGQAPPPARRAHGWPCSPP